MRAHPWRSRLGARLRDLADTVEHNPRPGAGLQADTVEHRRSEGRAGKAPGTQREPHIAVDGLGHGGRIDPTAEPEWVRGMNLTDAPEHWARLVRESASRRGGHAESTNLSVEPSALGGRRRIHWRQRRRAPARLQEPPGYPSNPWYQDEDRRLVTAAPGTTEPTVTPAPVASEPPDRSRPGRDAPAAPPAAEGASPASPEAGAGPAAARRPRLMLRPQGQPARPALQAAEPVAIGSTETVAPAPAMAMTAPTRLSSGTGIRFDSELGASAESSAAVRSRGDVPPAGVGSQSARTATPRRSAGPEQPGDLVAAIPARFPRTDDMEATAPQTARTTANTAGGARSHPPGRGTPPAPVPHDDRRPDRPASPAERGRWPERPARPPEVTGLPPSAVAWMLARADRLNKEQAAV